MSATQLATYRLLDPMTDTAKQATAQSIATNSSQPGGVTNKRPWAWLVLLFLGVAWGLSFSLARMSTEGGAHPLGINYWVSLIGALLLLVVNSFKGRRLPLKKNYLFLYVICGLLGSVIPGILYFYAASRITAGVLAITVATVPLMTFIGAAVLRVEKISIMRILGVLFGIFSVALLVAPNESLPDPAATPWVLIVVLAALCYTAENLIIALRMPADANPFVIVTGMLLAATLMMTPAVWLTGTFEPLTWPLGRPGWAILGMAAISVIAYGLFLYLVMYAGPVFASQTAYVVTLSGVLWGILIFGESHSLWIWLSLVTMMVALSLVKPRTGARPG